MSAGSVIERILLVVYMRKFSPVDWQESERNDENKFVPFATIVALFSRFLIDKGNLKWKHIDNYAILATMMRTRSYFVKKKVSPLPPELECSL